MANFVELHNQWRGFAADRARARKDIDDELAENNARIEELRLRNVEINTTVASEFMAEWKRKKLELQEARDQAVMEEMAKGRSAQAILRELGSQNTVWIYKLRANLVAEGRLPETQNENSAPVSKARLNAKQHLDDQMDASEYEHIQWFAGTGPDLTGWYISEDEQFVKHQRRGGRWFIAGPQNEFLKGDKGFYDLIGEDAIADHVDKLLDLLDGSKKTA
jgi:hypothetical protein